MAKVVAAQIILWLGLLCSVFTISQSRIRGYRVRDDVIDVDAGNVTINIITPSCRADKDDPCYPNPCKYGGKCVTTDDKNDYTCDCPFPMGGRKCGKLSCKMETTCFRLSGTVYFVYPYAPYSNQSEAEDFCIRQGQALAQLKEKPLLDFTSKQLLALYADRPDAKAAVWIALKRTSKTDPWKWSDGSELAYTDGWAPDRPGDDLCGNLSNGPKLQFLLDDDPCDGWSSWTYYPLCQQTFSFLAHT